MNKQNIFPVVSIIMANYNYEKFINYAIESVISQSFKDWELIIVDDFSTDNSIKIIQNWIKKDNRVKAIFHDRNKGIARTFNDGLKNAKGKYIIIMASDDMLKECALEEALDILDTNQYGTLIFEAELIDYKNKKIGLRFSDIYRKPPIIKGNFFKELLKGNFIMTGMIKRCLITKFNIYFNEELKHLNDWLFWLDLARICDFYYIENPLYYYRIHKSNSSLDIDGYIKDEFKIYNIIKQRYKLDKESESILYKRKALTLYVKYLQDFKNARKYLWKSIIKHPLAINNITTFALIILTYFPKLFNNILKIYFSKVKKRHIIYEIQNIYNK